MPFAAAPREHMTCVCYLTGGASATSSKLKPFEDAARAAAGGAPSKPAPPPKPGARRPASAEGDGDEYEEVSTSSSGTPTHARGGHGGKAPEKGRGAGLVKRPSMRFAFDDAPPDEDDEYYNESEIERLAAEGQAPGASSVGSLVGVEAREKSCICVSLFDQPEPCNLCRLGFRHNFSKRVFFSLISNHKG